VPLEFCQSFFDLTLAQYLQPNHPPEYINMSLDMVVFQATTLCNINCKYCYLPEVSRRSSNKMSSAVLDRASRLILRSNLIGQSVTILWHAGEPLAAGLPFYVNAMACLQKNNIYARKMVQTVQTNGILISQKWCDFFKHHEFEVGVSIDGPSHLHNRNRIGWNGQDTFLKTMNGIRLLQKNNISFAAICVLTEDILDCPDEIFDFFLSNGFKSVGFNLDEIEAANTTSSLLGATNGAEFHRIRNKYAAFMTRLVQRWIQAEGKLCIREFENFSSKIVLQKLMPGSIPAPDVTQGLRIITVRSDGSITTFSPELASGTLSNPDAFVVGHIDQADELEDIVANPRYLELRREINRGISRCESDCGYFRLCGGGFPSNKFYERGTFDCSETRHCAIHTKTLLDVVFEQFAFKPEFGKAISDYISRKTAINTHYENDSLQIL
jgi:uncharacterized protein